MTRNNAETIAWGACGHGETHTHTRDHTLIDIRYPPPAPSLRMRMQAVRGLRPAGLPWAWRDLGQEAVVIRSLKPELSPKSSASISRPGGPYEDMSAKTQLIEIGAQASTMVSQLVLVLGGGGAIVI